MSSASMKELSNTIELDVSYEGIKVVPDFIIELKAIGKLHMNYNNLKTRITDNLSNLTSVPYSGTYNKKGTPYLINFTNITI